MVGDCSPHPLHMSANPLPGAFTPPGGSVGPIDLQTALRLAGRKSFLVRHQVLSLGHSYTVMDEGKQPLFEVKGNKGQNIRAALVGDLVATVGGGYLGRRATRSMAMSYSLTDAQGTVWGTIQKEGSANSSVFTLVDRAGFSRVVITVQRSFMGGIQATAVSPDGRPMLQSEGNLLRHNFKIRDGVGNEVAKVHEKWVAIADTYNVDLFGNFDPLYPLLYAILIDYEKVK